MVRARSTGRTSALWIAQVHRDIGLQYRGTDLGQNPLCAACQRLPASTVISMSAGPRPLPPDAAAAPFLVGDVTDLHPVSWVVTVKQRFDQMFVARRIHNDLIGMNHQRRKQHGDDRHRQGKVATFWHLNKTTNANDSLYYSDFDDVKCLRGAGR